MMRVLFFKSGRGVGGGAAPPICKPLRNVAHVDEWQPLMRIHYLTCYGFMFKTSGRVLGGQPPLNMRTLRDVAAVDEI